MQKNCIGALQIIRIQSNLHNMIIYFLKLITSYKFMQLNLNKFVLNDALNRHRMLLIKIYMYEYICTHLNPFKFRLCAKHLYFSLVKFLILIRIL